MSNVDLQECEMEFNIPTIYTDLTTYKKRMQESTDPFNYRMDIKPNTYCFIENTQNQGLQIAQKAPPVNLLDIEMKLRLLPLASEFDHYIIDDIYNVEPPELPSVLDHRLQFSECPKFMNIDASKTPRLSFENRPELSQRKQPDYMRPGSDTRTEVRDYFANENKKRVEEKKKEEAPINAIIYKKKDKDSIDSTVTYIQLLKCRMDNKLKTQKQACNIGA